MDVFASKWDNSHLTISRSWRRNRERITPLFSYPPERDPKGNLHDHRH
jgi:putative transposase